MEESRAAMMLLTMIGKSGEITIRLAAKSAETLTKMAAMLSALWQRATPGGKITLAKMMENGAPLSAITMTGENYQQFKGLAKDLGINYYPLHNKNTDSYMVTMKTDDIQRMQTAFDFYNQQPEELQQTQARLAAETPVTAAAPLSAEQAEFENRKQQILKETGCVDFEAWQKMRKEGQEMPNNLNLCLKTDDAVIQQVKQDKKAEKLNEAKAVKDLKQKKVNELGAKQPKMKNKEMTPKL